MTQLGFNIPVMDYGINILMDLIDLSAEVHSTKDNNKDYSDYNDLSSPMSMEM